MSKNSYYNNRQKGDYIECCARKHLEASGYRVLFHRLKTFYCEVDFLLEDPKTNELVLCEVKKWTFYDGGLSQPVGDAQRRRLQQALTHLSIASNRGVKSLLVTASMNTSGFPEFREFENFLAQ